MCKSTKHILVFALCRFHNKEWDAVNIVKLIQNLIHSITLTRTGRAGNECVHSQRVDVEIYGSIDFSSHSKDIAETKLSAIYLSYIRHDILAKIGVFNYRESTHRFSRQAHLNSQLVTT